MTPAQSKLAAALLDLAAESYSNHGCNDFNLREVLTDTEAREIVRQLNEYNAQFNPGCEREPDSDCIEDWSLMLWLARVLEGES